MFKNAILVVAVTFLLAGVSSAKDFDCDFPPFGTSINNIESDGEFIKYKEKNGVSYYNYTGKCELPIHQRVNPAISYGFVEDKLFAKIVTYSVADVNTGNKSTFREFLKEKYPEQVAGAAKKKSDGDWDVYKVEMSDKDITLKYKHNKVLQLVKSSWYYNPLRKTLKDLNKEK